VRGQDLGSVLEGQREIQRWLGAAEEPRALPVPSVFHCSLVTRDDGGRLEKRTKGVTLPELMALGWTRSAIVARFAASLDAVIEELVATELSRGVFETVFAESKSQLTIGELGFSGPPC
jgi:glutamyl/glutaminyl-tRNA synthetase